jgi:hypothetical protein
MRLGSPLNPYLSAADCVAPVSAIDGADLEELGGFAGLSGNAAGHGDGGSFERREYLVKMRMLSVDCEGWEALPFRCRFEKQR